jgi:hypothetical protein
LLGKSGCAGKDSKKSLTPTELYFLVLSILFHDSGNVFDRKGHESRLEEAYTFARGNSQSLAPEKRLLFQIVRSHCGETSEGSSDTIGLLDPKGSFSGKHVDCQRVGTVLRLADELAEGPQRTSLFMQRYQPFPAGSQVYHDYANIVSSIHIDAGNERIAIIYDIDIAPETWSNGFDEERLSSLLNFCYHRIVKLDLERKYNRHYCSLLRPFKKSEFSLNFHYRTKPLDVNLGKITLDDLILPDPPMPTDLLKQFDDLNITNLMPQLKKLAHDLVAPGKHS